MGRRRGLRDKVLDRAAHEYSARARLVALALLAPVFLALLPYLFLRSGARIDQWMQWPPILPPPANLVVGLLLILPGILLGLWANHRLFTTGRGTPVPLMATQELIVEPPYTYCRNPMALGAISMYLGVALLYQSIGAVLVVLLLAAALLAYIRRGEEQEMRARFGDDYLAYRNSTPFLIPRIGRRAQVVAGPGLPPGPDKSTRTG
jgi:protein-S-isoprenylcysteine O-methyltransferase Ste14